MHRRDEPKFIVLMRDRDGHERQFPVTIATLCSMIKEMNNWLAILGTLTSREAATVLLHHPNAPGSPAKVLHISQRNGRSTYDNPLGK